VPEDRRVPPSWPDDVGVRANVPPKACGLCAADGERMPDCPYCKHFEEAEVLDHRAKPLRITKDGHTNTIDEINKIIRKYE